MNSITVNCPAKINLTLEIVNKREDGFHNIKSIMQTISLYDTLIIAVKFLIMKKTLYTELLNYFIEKQALTMSGQKSI